MVFGYILIFCDAKPLQSTAPSSDTWLCFSHRCRHLHNRTYLIEIPRNSARLIEPLSAGAIYWHPLLFPLLPLACCVGVAVHKWDPLKRLAASQSPAQEAISKCQTAGHAPWPALRMCVSSSIFFLYCAASRVPFCFFFCCCFFSCCCCSFFFFCYSPFCWCVCVCAVCLCGCLFVCLCFVCRISDESINPTFLQATYCFN